MKGTADATPSGVNTKSPIQVLAPLALALGLAACASEATPKESSVPAQPEAFVAPPPEPLPASRPAQPSPLLASPPVAQPPQREPSRPVVEASGDMTEQERVVLSAVAVCMQQAVDKGAKLHDRHVVVNVTVDPSGAISEVGVVGANDRLRSCVEPEVKQKAHYAPAEPNGGMRVMQYRMDTSVGDPE